MTIIHIETSTDFCSVSLSNNGVCVFEISNNEKPDHAATLSPFIQQAIDLLKSMELNIDAVAVSGGPGSYTGLRIGVSTAKGLCYGYNIPLIAIDTLQIMAESALKETGMEHNALLCPMIDARRMEVYTALYTTRHEQVKEVTAEVVDENTFGSILEKQPVYFFGNGSEKCKPVIIHPNARFISGIAPLAVNMIRLAEEKFINTDFADVAYYEPFYLKEFQTTVSKKKV